VFGCFPTTQPKKGLHVRVGSLAVEKIDCLVQNRFQVRLAVCAMVVVNDPSGIGGINFAASDGLGAVLAFALEAHVKRWSGVSVSIQIPKCGKTVVEALIPSCQDFIHVYAVLFATQRFFFGIAVVAVVNRASLAFSTASVLENATELLTALPTNFITSTRFAKIPQSTYCAYLACLFLVARVTRRTPESHS
jgi:hypothetical protein